jgi:hypothetical protein
MDARRTYENPLDDSLPSTTEYSQTTKSLFPTHIQSVSLNSHRPNVVPCSLLNRYPFLPNSGPCPKKSLNRGSIRCRTIPSTSPTSFQDKEMVYYRSSESPVTTHQLLNTITKTPQIRILVPR